MLRRELIMTSLSYIINLINSISSYTLLHCICIIMANLNDDTSNLDNFIEATLVNLSDNFNAMCLKS